MTKRKLYTRFRLVPKLMTMDDLERPLRTLLQNACVFGPAMKMWIKVDPHYQRRLCKPNDSSFWQFRVYADIRGGSLERGVIENVDFQCFRTLRLRYLRKWGQRYSSSCVIFLCRRLTCYGSRSSAFLLTSV